ncbi:MAG: copper homeostasis protein CutC [Anaerolineales bacterium]|nr:copper homeostasis protein CutC [Chloroflexota bacterium]MBL7161835.1 copper homeostasis protein CutC [Anaerolineales bacterium]
MTNRLILEVCVDSVESAMAAEQGGADRVELCDNLLAGGTTPSAGVIELARNNLDLGLQVMIRPRGGDFCYSDIEFEIMRRDIEVAKQLGADGVVFGILRPDGSVDMERSATLVELAHPLNVTFHRAFDVSRDAHQSLADLISLGVNRILTSGQAFSALEGLDLIAELVQIAGDRVIIMPGGGTERNIQKVVASSGVKEVHVVGPQIVDSSMVFRNHQIYMGGELRPPEYTRVITDPEKISSLRNEARG